MNRDRCQPLSLGQKPIITVRKRSCLGGGGVLAQAQRVYLSMHWGRHHLPQADGYRCRRYASCWNAFLFGKIFAENCMKMKWFGPDWWSLGQKHIITARKRSCGKVMFLQVSVILFTGGVPGPGGGGGGVWSRDGGGGSGPGGCLVETLPRGVGASVALQ